MPRKFDFVVINHKPNSFNTHYFHIHDYLSCVEAVRRILSISILEHLGYIDTHSLSDMWADEERNLVIEHIKPHKIIKGFLLSVKKHLANKETIIMNSKGGWQILEKLDDKSVIVDIIKKEHLQFSWNNTEINGDTI